MGSQHFPNLTTSLLHSYSEAALRNANELLAESLLLRDHDHMARAYFLAVSCIEETGKALLAFDFQHRNFTDPAICKKVKTSMESHEQKINYALSVWALNSPDPREAIKEALDLTLQIKKGREPSMYSDLRAAPDRVQTPSEIVRPTAARDCIRLAENSLAYAHHHVRTKTPAKFSVAQEKLFTMKPAKSQEIMSLEDFWWYYISCMEAGNQDIAEAVLGYERDHIKTGTLFNDAQSTTT